MPRLGRIFSCFRGGPEAAAGIEVVKALPAKAPYHLQLNMANVRVPAAVVIDLLHDEVDYDHLTPRKRGRGQGPQVEG